MEYVGIEIPVLNLEISFLKFWIITERILGDNRGGKYLVKIIKKLLGDEYLKSLVDPLYKKRNLMVHKYRIDFITQLDRNLTKAISDKVILFLIYRPAKVKNIEELRFLLENMSLPNEQLIRKNKLISKMIKWKIDKNYWGGIEMINGAKKALKN